jgi:HlyD family secretion protein
LRNAVLIPDAALRFTPTDGTGAKSGLITMGPPKRGQGGFGVAGNDKTSTIGRGSQQTVYVLDGKGDPRPVKVTVGESNGSLTAVTGAELKPGMKVITGKLASTKAQ